MRILFVGASKFGHSCCEFLINNEIDVCGILSNENEFSISYSKGKVKNINYSDFSGLAKENGIPIYIMKNNMREKGLSEFIDSCNSDLAIVVGWYHMIPNSLLNEMRYFGIHASMLPKYSGGAPLVWAMIEGQKETGVTFFQFADGVDNGPIVEQKAIPILESDTIKSLYERVENVGKELMIKGLNRMKNGDFEFVLQNDEERTIYSQRSPEDGLIERSMTSKQCYDFIRAQTRPYPGAFINLDNKILKIWGTEFQNENPNPDLEKLNNHVFISKKGDELYIECSDKKWLRSTDFTYEEMA